MDNNPHQKIKQIIQNADNILIVSHVRPDGDAVGSLLGLGLALQIIGKKTQMVLVDGVPDNFLHLPGKENIINTPQAEYDLSIVVDCSDLERTGILFNKQKPDINIDHHVTNTNFSLYNVVESDSVATSAILAENMTKWGLPIDENISECLITGIITDTIGFQTPNMNADALRTVADLLDSGATLSELYYKALINRSFEAARFWGIGLSNLSKEDGLIWSVITHEERISSSYNQRDDAELSNFLSTIDNSAISVLFMEQSSNNVKVSWRAKTGYDVSALAYDFGGGGHQAAAGADIEGSLEDVKRKVLLATKNYLSR